MKTNFRKIRNLLLLFGLIVSGVKGQLSGPYSVPGSYASIAAAISDLNIYGVNGPVTINVAAGYTETAIAGGYTLSSVVGASSINQVIFQKSGAGANPVIYAYTGVATPASAAQDGVWRFSGTDWVTIDRIDITDLNVANPATMEFGYGLFRANATDGCQNNTIKNCVITLNKVNNDLGSGPASDGSRGIDVVDATSSAHTTALTITSAGGTNSNNKFYTNTIQNCNIGIALIGYAAGSPFTLADTGNDIGGTSAVTGNSIFNFGGGATTSAAAGIQTLAQYGLNVSFNFLNNNNGAGVSHAAALRGIFVNTATSANASINSNTLTLQSLGTTALLTGIQNASGATAAGNAININNNVITGCTYATATSAVFTGIVNSAASATLNINNNILTNNSTAATSGVHVLISNSGAVTSAINMNNNNINGFNFTSVTAGTFNYIFNSGGAGTAALTISNNSIQAILHTSASSTAHNLIRNTSATLSQTMNNNTFINLNLNTTGSVAFISNDNALPVGGFATINNNSIVTGFNKSGAGGTVTLYLTTGGPSSAIGTLKSEQNNNFSNITLTGATIMAGWIDLEGATGGGSFKTIANNTFTNWACGSSAVTGINANFSGPNTTISSNTISNISGTGAITGILYGASNGSTNHNISFNNISGLNSITTGGTVLGISILGTGANPLTVSNNIVGGLSTIGASPVTGIACAATQVINMFKNKIYDLQSNNGSGTVFGINITSGATTNIYNNLVGDLRAPASNAANPLIGISLTGGTTHNLSYNTVYINGSSSGTNFGSSAISVNATPTTINLRNNIFVNNSTAVGTGSTVAYRRASAVLTNYGATSNNNLFYAGSPGAGNLIFYDGTNFIQTLAAFKALMVTRDGVSVTENPTFISTSGANANFLNINTATPTQVESGGAAVSGIADDYAGTIRGTFPDIGAWEGGFTPGGTDVSPPALLASGFTTGPCSTSARTYTASLADVSGVGTGLLAPRVYYKVNAGGYLSVAGTLTSGNASLGIWSFNLAFTAATNDVISYYLVAQDAAGTPNLMASPSAGFAGTNVNSITTDPTTPNTFILNFLNGVYTVGALGTFTTLTAAAFAYNNYCLTGAVTFSLIDALYSTNETYPIIFQNNLSASATNSLLIRPAAGLAVSLTPTLTTINSVLKFLNARYINVDGINSGGSSLVINNSNTSSASANIWLASTNGVGSGNNFIAVKNTTLQGGYSSGSNGVLACIDGAAPSGTGGSDNDNITVTGNTLLTFYHGILGIGTTSVSAGGLDNWFIANNIVGPAVSGTANITGNGIAFASALNVTITGNVVQNLVTTGAGISALNMNANITGFSISQNTITNILSTAAASGVNSIAGLYCGTEVINGTVSSNKFITIASTTSSGYGVRALIINTGNANSNITIRNNFITDIWNFDDVALIYSPSGIAIEGASGGLNIDYNTINLFGSHTGFSTGTTLSHCIFIGSTSGNLNIRNNMLSNTYDNSSSTTDINYAIYSSVAAGNFSIINYNNYYVGGTNIGFLGSNLTTLATLQTAFGQNANSQNIQPTFVSNTDLHMSIGAASNYALDNLGTPIAGVTTDIDATVRNITTPDIGAHEWTSTATCTTANGGTLSTAAYTLCSNQTQALIPTGVSAGIGSAYQWRVSNTPGGPYTNLSIGTGATTKSYITSTVTGGVYYYILTATCSTGPSVSSSNEVTVTVNSSPSPAIVSSPSVICGSGSATLTATGASSYLWNTGATTSSIVVTPTASGAYNVIGSNAPCANVVSGNFNLFFSLTPIVNATSATTVVCAGIPATLTASGANTYSWSNGSTSPVINPTPSVATTYTVTGYKANGCNSSVTQSIDVNPAPNVSISGSSGICTGQNASLTAIGAISYSWNTGALTNSIVTAPTSNTVYIVTGTDGLGCSSTVSQSVSVAASLSISISGTQSLCLGQTASLTANGGVTYLWDSGALTTTIAPTPTITTTYSVVGSSGTCSNSAVRTVSVNPNPTVTVSGNTVVCVGLSTTLSASGASTYIWNTTATTATISVAPTNTTNYSVIGTSSLGCIGTRTVTVSTNTVPVITVARSSSVVCLNSTATFTASGAVTYTWNPVQPQTAIITVTPATATNYTVSGTNPAGCISSATTSIGVNALPSITITPASATVCTLSQLNLQASGATTYTWNGNNLLNTAAISFTPVNNTTYTVVATNANGCVSSKTIGVTTNSLPVMSFVPPSATVCAQSAVNFTVSGANTYFWNSNNVTTPFTTFFPSANTIFTVTGTSSQGCSSTATVMATALPLPAITVSPSFTTVCVLSTNTYTASGAVTYTWNGNSAFTGPTLAITSTSASSYGIVGTGTNGCDGSGQFVVLTNPLPVITISASSPTVCSQQPVQFISSGATTYTWNSGVVNDTTVVNPVINTTYTVTGTDGTTGCVGTQTVSVITNSLPAIAISPASPTVCVKTPVTFTASGGVTYSWSTGSPQINISVTPTANVSYTLTGTDAAGCTNFATVTIVTNTLPTILVSPVSPTICAGETVNFIASGASTYTWGVNNSTSATLSIIPAFSTFYSVIGVDVNNCKNTGTVTIIVSPCAGIVTQALAENAVSVFPNPSTGFFTAKFEFEGTKTIVITNSTGQVVSQTVTDNMSQDFDLGGLAKGIYFVRVSSKQASGNYKIVMD